MSDERDEWVRVESASEIRAGMPLQFRTCPACHNVDVVFVVSDAVTPDPYSESATDGKIVRNTEPVAWLMSGGCLGLIRRKTVLEGGIQRGAVFRLRDLPAEETTTVATKRRVSA